MTISTIVKAHNAKWAAKIAREKLDVPGHIVESVKFNKKTRKWKVTFSVEKKADQSKRRGLRDY